MLVTIGCEASSVRGAVLCAVRLHIPRVILTVTCIISKLNHELSLSVDKELMEVSNLLKVTQLWIMARLLNRVLVRDPPPPNLYATWELLIHGRKQIPF